MLPRLGRNPVGKRVVCVLKVFPGCVLKCSFRLSVVWCVCMCLVCTFLFVLFCFASRAVRSVVSPLVRSRRSVRQWMHLLIAQSNRHPTVEPAASQSGDACLSGC